MKEDQANNDARYLSRAKGKIIEQWMGEKVVKADAHFTRDITGFAPVGHKK